jgi:hypothetical protein
MNKSIVGNGFLAFAMVLLLQFQSSETWGQGRKSGDLVTSDLINNRIVIGPVEDARYTAPDTIENRKVALSAEDIQQELSEGVAEIHRGAVVSRISGKPGLDRALFAAREQGADLLIIPRIEQLLVDQMGRNGLDPVAKMCDVLLFPVTLAEVVIYRGDRAGLGSQYLPLYNMMITLRINMDYYRVSDSKMILRQNYTRVCDSKVNRDNLDGSRFDITDDWHDFGQKQGRFLVREFGKEIAQYEIIDLIKNPVAVKVAVKTAPPQPEIQ